MRSKTMYALLIVAQLLWVGGAWAQTQIPPTPQFAFTGFIQEATLDTAGTICTPTDPRLAGGTITVNGIKMMVPCNSIVQFPAATFSWADLFDPALSTPVGSYIGGPGIPVPANPVTGGVVKSGLALADNPAPFPSFVVSVVGNVVGKNPDGTDRYIVGLITPIEQQVLNGSSGIVSYIDYAAGAFRVGGIANDPACDPLTPGGGPGCSGTLLQINDPVGRWGLIHSPDPRFSGDFENTTIHVSNGMPLCLPRVAPPAVDPECPLGNRPLNGDPRFPVDPFIALGQPLKIFQMPPPPGQPGADPSGFPDASKQVPMMVGDQVLWIGTLYKIDPLKTIVDPVTGATIPDNTPANIYMSVHTVDDVMEITTAPGVPPAYIFVEGMLIGSGGAAVQGILQEASTRLTVVGFTSDPTRPVEIYAKDVNPCTGQETRRLLAITDPATQAFLTRFVHRVNGGLFMPPTRNYVMVSQTQLLDPTTGQRVEQIVGNGIVAGEFSLPNFEYIMPENHRFGDPLVPFNFQDLPFLAQGEGPLDGFGTASPLIGRLDPWPGDPALLPPLVSCAGGGGANPIVNAGPDVAAAIGSQVLLAGSVTWDTNSDPTTRTVQWAQVTGTPVTIQNANTLLANFLAPDTPGVLTFTLTATDNIGTGSDTVNITVLAPADIVQITVATWVVQNGKRGGFGKLNVTATSSDPTASLSLTEIGVDGSVTNWGTASKTTPGVYDWVENKGAPQPASLTVTSDRGGSATVTCSAPDARGRVTCP